MNFEKNIILERDVAAILIPDATPFEIPAGTAVQITQTMGGNFTVAVAGNLARIAGKDADALGLPIPENAVVVTAQKQATGPVDIEQVWDALRQCFDPEIPVNIVDLGLVYTCEVKPSEDGKQNEIIVQMTLTAPGCGMGPVLAYDVEAQVLTVPNVTSVTVDIVFEPVWNQDMMSDAAKLELGLL